MTRRDYTIRDIHMALDGELSAEDRESYEVLLAAKPEMKAMSVRVFRASSSRFSRSPSRTVLQRQLPKDRPWRPQV